MMYVLKAACVFCGHYGRIDDVSLICSNCGEPHAITPAEDAQRQADMSLWSSRPIFRPLSGYNPRYR